MIKDRKFEMGNTRENERKKDGEDKVTKDWIIMDTKAHKTKQTERALTPSSLYFPFQNYL